jgi:hypothetical protein
MKSAPRVHNGDVHLYSSECRITTIRTESPAHRTESPLALKTEVLMVFRLVGV